MKDSKISWTHHTFNPWWGCVKVSPGCANCYAETFAKRTGNNVWGASAERRFFGDKHWNEPIKWDAEAAKLGERHRVFCASMADWLEDREDLIQPLARLLDMIRRTPNLDWLLLTKRPENFIKRLGLAARYTRENQGDMTLFCAWGHRQPPSNVWIGTTVENQEMADKRIPQLLEIPAKVRFLSCEPLLEALDLSAFIGQCITPVDVVQQYNFGIHWVITGGESGPGFRPFNPDWARSLRDQCKTAGVPFHMKQMGGLKPSMMPPIPDDLMIREWPEGGAK